VGWVSAWSFKPVSLFLLLSLLAQPVSFQVVQDSTGKLC